ncbi:no significant homology [hydrothermal vent metagenome]|uniref:No significant homology n=1 Tax=hydrothermal vent metagenome TaxID=652676 RepID=A0A1W1CWL0_9ZZZZ
MKYHLLIPLTLTTILFIGCQKSQKDNNKNSSIAINKIEQNITNKETNLGCENNNGSSSEECTEEEMDSAKFILNTLKKDIDTSENNDINLIKENLTVSLKEIEKEKNKKNRLKDSLENLVNELNENKKKDLESFVNQIDDSEFKSVKENRLDSPYKNTVSNIKSELKNLIEIEDTKVKPKVVKKRLEILIADVTDSKKSLEQTKKSLKNLIKEVGKKNASSSVKKFASAIIKDVSSKKISIIKENEKYLTIKVKQGDNLSLLAERYYNNKNKYKLIYDANKDKINSKYEIYPGTELLIPKI